MPSLNLVRAIIQHAASQGSRSTVLKPIGWMITICISATLAAVYLGLAVWVAYMFATFCGLTMLLYLVTYIYCLLTDKDALRSETYTIQKMAIEKGFIGDDLMGIINIDKDIGSRLIESSDQSVLEVDK